MKIRNRQKICKLFWLICAALLFLKLGKFCEERQLLKFTIYDFYSEKNPDQKEYAPIWSNKLSEKTNLLIGIPTVKRSAESYLQDTLNSIRNDLKQFKNAENFKISIILFAGKSDKEYFDELQETYKNELGADFAILMAPDDYYKEYFDKPIRPTFGDTVERMSWRTMQALDYIFLWENAMKFPLYLQLEDDVQINPGFFDFVISSINLNSKKNWFSLEFSPLGFIGKLFKSDSLLSLTQYSKLFFDVKPIDWIYWSFIRMKVCSPEWDKKKCQAEVRLAAISCTSKTPFLNHIGSISSLDGKVQHLVERAQGNPETSKILCSDNIRLADIETIYSSAKTIEISSNSKPSSMQFNFKHLQSPKQFIFYHGTKLPGKEKSEIDSQIPQNTILYADINEQGWTEIMAFSKCFSSSKSTTIGVQTICKMQGFSKSETIINGFKIIIPAAHPSFLISKIDVKR